ncbi:MAG: Stf0 family sulfotransferase [Paracoccaceae bacterium]
MGKVENPNSVGNSVALENEKSGPWQRQFNTEFDFAPCSISKKFALCTTPRCGSHFFGHKLHQTGCFGYPLEYFNDGNWRAWGKRAAKSISTLDYIHSVRTGPNGVFATKLHHEHLKLFLEKEKDPLSYRFIHLQRRDLLRQAVSFARAQQTGAWISDMPELSKASYDWGMISQKVDAISLGNANWDSFLTSTGARRLTMYYEDIAADPAAAILKISEFLEIEQVDIGPTKKQFTPRKQSLPANKTEDWSDRYIQDCQARLANSKPIAGVHYLPPKFGPKPSAVKISKAFLRNLRMPT